MKILITGARGNFPTALIRRLDSAGYDLVLLDLALMDSAKHKVIQADIRDSGAVTFAMQGCEAVIHAAALDSEQDDSRNNEEFYSVNVTGTHNVLIAMHRLGVKHLVFSSSDDVYGEGMKGRRMMDESVERIPTSIFAATKALGEDLCRFYSRAHAMRIAILRYGRFAPADWKTAGLGRLGNWMDREDAAQANQLALAALTNDEFQCEAFLIQCSRPFVDSDWPLLAENPAPVVENLWPGSVVLLGAHGLKVPRLHVRYDIGKAQKMLGFTPEHNFEEFLGRLQREPQPVARLRRVAVS